MSQRYYVCDILPPDGTKDYYRLAIDDAVPGVGFAAIIPTLPNGQPAFSWGLCYAKSSDWSGVDANPKCVRIFQGNDDGADLAEALNVLGTVRWSDITTPRKNAIRAALQTLGIATGDISAQMALREILQKIGRFLQPGFDETKLHVDGGQLAGL